MGAESVEAAAEGFVAVAVEQMAQAVRRISTERGFDPRDHALVAFGGAAGQVACQTAEALGVERDPLPQLRQRALAPGASARRRSRRCARPGWRRRWTPRASPAPQALLAEVEAAARAAMAEQGAEAGDVRRTLRLRYDGADAELPVPLSDLADAKADVRGRPPAPVRLHRARPHHPDRRGGGGGVSAAPPRGEGGDRKRRERSGPQPLSRTRTRRLEPRPLPEEEGGEDVRPRRLA